VITIRPNLPTIATKIMARNLSSSELLDLDAAFWRDGAGGLHPLPDSRGRNPQRFSHAIDVAEEMDSFMDVHESKCKPLVNTLLTIAQIFQDVKNERMVNNNETEWLAARIREAIATSGLTQVSIAEICGVSRAAVTMWGKRGTIKKSLLPKVALATNRPLSFFIYGADEIVATSQIAQQIKDKLSRLDSLGLLNEAALSGLLAHINSYDPSTINDQSITEEHKGPRPTGPDLTPDGKPIMGNSDETESKFDALIAAQNARTNKKTG
jgi:transcriptional regulator with XRE-family HTH domain